MDAIDPDEYQELLNGRDDVDNVPVGLTRYQAQKCAAIIMAGCDGHTMYTEAAATVARYLARGGGAPGVPPCLFEPPTQWAIAWARLQR